MKFFKKAKKAFTLVELITVMAIIAVLAGVSVGAYFGIIENAKKSAARQEADQIKTQLVAATSGDGYAATTAKYKLAAGTTGFTAVMTTNDTITFTFTTTEDPAVIDDVRFAIGYIVADNNGTLNETAVENYAKNVNAETTDFTITHKVVTVKGFIYNKDGKVAKTTLTGSAANATTSLTFDAVNVTAA